MRILGLSSFQHDTSAALLEDGVVKAAIENDKLARARTRNRPELAIRSCFESAGTDWSGLDRIAVAIEPMKSWLKKSWLRAKLSPTAPMASGYYAANEAGLLARELNHLRVLRGYVEEGENKVVGFDHHLCHAASAFFSSPFERSLIVTMDEGGDGTAGMLAVGEGNRIRVLRTIPFPHSLAWVYSQVTDLAGFQPHLDEHKTQWLSFAGEPVYKDVFLKMFRGGSRAALRLDYSFFHRGLANQVSFSEKFYRIAGLPQDRKQIAEEQSKNLAASIQAACVDLITPLVEDLRRSENVKNVCFAGGLFQNVLLVAALEKNLGASEVFVPAAPGNAGTAPGAALLAWHHTLQKPRSNNDVHAYLGPKFDRHAVKDVLDNTKSRYTLPTTEDRKLETAVQLLQAGKIVGWFQGAAEFGPRALGNRSVLASPWAPYVKENLNDFIKHREWFRPFAISVPEEDCARYFAASRQCRFMNSLADVLPGNSCLPESFLLPDGRVRLHIVDRRSNPVFWALLKRFGDNAPAPMLLNTSFNLFGEPLVVSPRDAMRSYFGSGLDALIIDKFVLSKAAVHSAAINLPVNRVGLGA
ncbi:MAG TPA: carbamoyltransferase C-terminal domain-containing protein [Terriglobales bacterium]|nr:carbamoyltransferase C-terminal domain-containing protein [Terriglobales bacterium]